LGGPGIYLKKEKKKKKKTVVMVSGLS